MPSIDICAPHGAETRREAKDGTRATIPAPSPDSAFPKAEQAATKKLGCETLALSHDDEPGR